MKLQTVYEPFGLARNWRELRSGWQFTSICEMSPNIVYPARQQPYLYNSIKGRIKKKKLKDLERPGKKP